MRGFGKTLRTKRARPYALGGDGLTSRGRAHHASSGNWAETRHVDPRAHTSPAMARCVQIGLGMTYIIKLSGCKAGGRNVDGEYDGGHSIDEARREAADFASATTGGTITITKPTRGGVALSFVESVR